MKIQTGNKRLIHISQSIQHWHDSQEVLGSIPIEAIFYFALKRQCWQDSTKIGRNRGIIETLNYEDCMAVPFLWYLPHLQIYVDEIAFTLCILTQPTHKQFKWVVFK